MEATIPEVNKWGIAWEKISSTSGYSYDFSLAIPNLLTRRIVTSTRCVTSNVQYLRFYIRPL